MLIVIKSPPGSPDASKAVRKAAELAADILLVGDAVGLARRDMLEGFCGTAFALSEHLHAMLPTDTELEKGVKLISRAEMNSMLGKTENPEHWRVDSSRAD